MGDFCCLVGLVRTVLSLDDRFSELLDFLCLAIVFAFALGEEQAGSFRFGLFGLEGCTMCLSVGGERLDLCLCQGQALLGLVQDGCGLLGGFLGSCECVFKPFGVFPRIVYALALLGQIVFSDLGPILKLEQLSREIGAGLGRQLLGGSQGLSSGGLGTLNIGAGLSAGLFDLCLGLRHAVPGLFNTLGELGVLVLCLLLKCLEFSARELSLGLGAVVGLLRGIFAFGRLI